MSAQEYYRDNYSRPLSPPTDTADTSGNHDHYDATDADGRDPERATSSPDRLDTLPSPSHERDHSGLSDTSEYREAYDEGGSNPYGKNYNMTNEESKEPLVPPPHGRSSRYQDLGARFPNFFYSPAC